MSTSPIPAEQFRALLPQSIEALGAIEVLAEPLARAATLLRDCLLSGHKVLACGNGGSAGDASHLVTELIVRFQDDRNPFPAVSLNDSGSTLTAAANDYGFEHVFARQVRALGRRGDVLVGFSTSGNSVNVARALETAREIGVTTIAFLGRGGGKMKGKSDLELIVPNDVTARIQECHLVMYHALCTMIDPALRTGRVI